MDDTIHSNWKIFLLQAIGFYVCAERDPDEQHARVLFSVSFVVELFNRLRLELGVVLKM